MKFSIVTAWKDLGDPDRRAAFEWTSRYWATVFPEAEQVVATPSPFTRAAGLNEAVRRSRFDVIFQADPDTVVPVEQALAALALAGEADGLVVPYGRYLYLAKAATAVLHAAPDFLDLPSFGPDDCQEYGRGGAGPVTVFSRRTWDTVVGYDERFPLWGGDDGAFAYACDAYFGATRRVDGPALHSYHPRLPASIPGTKAYAAQFEILAAYRDAAALGPDAVRAIVEKRRPASSSGP